MVCQISLQYPLLLYKERVDSQFKESHSPKAQEEGTEYNHCATSDP